MARPSPFLLHCWLLQWWRHYGGGCRLAVQVAYRGPVLVGALPLIVHRRRSLEVATFLGGRQSVLADVLLAPGEDPAVAATLVERAVTGQDYVDVFGLPGGCLLAEVAGRRRLHLFERIEAPVLDLSAGWEAVYREKTSGETRRLHRRRRRQLASLGRIEVSVARTPAELEPALEHAFRLHSLRWEGRSDGSGFVTPTGLRFHRATMRALGELDVARIVSLDLDGRPIAFHYYFALAGRAYLHRVAFDPAFSRYSPGLVNILDSLEVIEGEGLTRVEFLGGAERYKRALADRFEPLHLAIGLPGTPAGRAVVAARAGWLAARESLKRRKAARRLYDGLAPARRLLARPRDVLRPSGVGTVED
jgi:CelD/BcsL family acetyltransferase involved in cellulose biosynthesis